MSNLCFSFDSRQELSKETQLYGVIFIRSDFSISFFSIIKMAKINIWSPDTELGFLHNK